MKKQIKEGYMYWLPSGSIPEECELIAERFNGNYILSQKPLPLTGQNYKAIDHYIGQFPEQRYLVSSNRFVVVEVYEDRKICFVHFTED